MSRKPTRPDNWHEIRARSVAGQPLVHMANLPQAFAWAVYREEKERISKKPNGEKRAELALVIKSVETALQLRYLVLGAFLGAFFGVLLGSSFS